MTKNVVTRFAPSPTGYLHIGGARTALFNWLYAKRHGGKMLLRIEDTDRSRSTDEAVEALMDGLSWLGMDWDGEPISQHANAERHREVAQQMVKDGTAYYCYSTAEEVNAMREKARAEGRPPRYDGTWRDRDASQAPEGVSPAIRLKAPLEGDTIVQDEVQGTVKFANKEMDDLVLLRSDGNPTYMLAVVVDDHDMNVTHIVRGDDHLTNAARQTLIYKALNWDVPVMAHIPLIYGPDGAKLSKRHGAIGAEAYRAMGYLPSAMRNYLARLGWSHGDDEIFSTEQMIEWFGFDAIGKSPSRFDFKKLENLNAHYMRSESDEELLGHFLTYLTEIEGGADVMAWIAGDGNQDKLLAALPGLKERAKTLIELQESARYLWVQRPLDLDAKAEKILSEEARTVLGKVLPALEALDAWTVESTEETVKAVAEEAELKLGKVAQPLRAALTGRGTSPGIFDVLVVLGKDESCARIRDHAA
ncbi:Glutamate--tRNA ligase [Pseudovibrio axinellae]|uniref:Glutamate--tRNA ligase n=1 Tax=Pseudovibrio axinellae TaxID=989403 RepID=A0A161VCI5_9HYPH|nr:glutamate--tRNA ligase [Pseudovibrio axinellae]KZL21896.1 Glutamate--tRNA ligase [Pseudovibrio axinellae]SEQ82815.1 glutamyl-tRNA synthetase [Pseudovibrio axinellae]